MFIIQALLALLLRSAGQILTTVFGWATVLLFGKVSANRQIYLSIMTFGSVLWIVVVIGIAFPAVSTFLLTFITLPPGIDHRWINWAMFGAALVVPLVVGLISIAVFEPENRPRGLTALAATVIKGYPYTFGLAITLVMLTLFAPVLKIRDLARRWTSYHVPVIVRPEDYVSVVGDVQRALAQGEIETTAMLASWMLRIPIRVLTFFVGQSAGRMVADRLMVLTAPTVELLMYPADLVVSGKELDAAHARAVLAEHLVFTRAYLTTTKEANRIEDELREIWVAATGHTNGSIDPVARERLADVERRLHQLKIPYEEWETLMHELLLVERQLRTGSPGPIADASGVTNEFARSVELPGVAVATRLAAAVATGILALATTAAHLRRRFRRRVTTSGREHSNTFPGFGSGPG